LPERFNDIANKANPWILVSCNLLDERLPAKFSSLRHDSA